MAVTMETKERAKHHITNIRYPYLDKWDKQGNYVEFEVANIHFSMSNAIRRTIISHVKSVGFKSEPHLNSTIDIKVNDTPLHNQYMAHRIAMIPIHIKNPDTFDVDDYQFIIDITNDTNAIRNITTEDFQVKRISTNTMLTRAEVAKMLPPDPITNGYILITKLKPKYYLPKADSAIVPPEIKEHMSKLFDKRPDEAIRFHVIAKAVISNGQENGHFAPASCATYFNTVDPDKARLEEDNYIRKQIETMKASGLTPYTEDKLRRTFETSERSRYFFTNERGEPNVFTFRIESVGYIPPLIIFYRAIDIIKNKLDIFMSNLVNLNDANIRLTPSGQFANGWELKIMNEDDTLGNLLQAHIYLMFADINLSQERNIVQHIGYRRTHPLDKFITVSVFSQKYPKFEDVITHIFHPACKEIIKILNIIQKELEDNSAFIKELRK